MTAHNTFLNIICLTTRRDAWCQYNPPHGWLTLLMPIPHVQWLLRNRAWHCCRKRLSCCWQGLTSLSIAVAVAVHFLRILILWQDTMARCRPTRKRIRYIVRERTPNTTLTFFGLVAETVVLCSMRRNCAWRVVAEEWTGPLADRVEREWRHSTSVAVVEGCGPGNNERSCMQRKDERAPKTTNTYCQYERCSWPNTSLT